MADQVERPLRVLISAYACNPYEGSEEGVGWGWARAISRFHDLWVITAEYHRADIERWRSEHPTNGMEFHYVRPKWWHYRLTAGWKAVESSILKPVMNIAYALWLREAYALAQDLHRDVSFDLVHVVTYVGFRFPGMYWRMGIPLVWGPVGVPEDVPWRFLPSLGLDGAICYAGKNVINSLQKALLQNTRRAFATAGRFGGVIAATEGVRRAIRRWYGQESQVICEIGSPVETAASHCLRAYGEPLRLIWSGVHQPGKALPLLLRALTLTSRDLDWRLSVLGAGPCTQRWKRLAGRLGLSDRVSWLGWVPRADALKVMRQGHAFVITSMYDLTSTVLLEALAQGLPVVCPDRCGFPDVVSQDSGILLPVRRPGQFIRDLAAALQTLGRDEVLRRRLAEGALRRVADFSWEAKGVMVDRIYRAAVSERRAVRRTLDRLERVAAADR